MPAYNFKKQFVAPILLGLGRPDPEAIFRAPGMVPKRQTIRAIGKRRHARPGETIQLYTGMRTRQCQAIGIATCVSVHPIDIYLQSDTIHVGKIQERETFTGAKRLDEFAHRDGFASWREMREFWLEEHGENGQMKKLGPWGGLLIRWEPILQSQLEAADD